MDMIILSNVTSHSTIVLCMNYLYDYISSSVVPALLVIKITR